MTGNLLERPFATLAELRTVGDAAVLEQRPEPGRPRTYHFPPFHRERLDNGLTVIHAHLPGRPLLSAQLLILDGAASEPPDRAGVTALTMRALTEGTSRRSAIELIEAAERLGAEIHADAGWESSQVSIDVPRSRLPQALALLAETVLQPSFPEAEVSRLREERLNDLLQAIAEPRRRVERAFAETVYAPSSPFSRPLAGSAETVEALGRREVREQHAQLLDPGSATLVVAGDLDGVPLVEMARSAFGDWMSDSRAAAATRGPVDDQPNPAGPRWVLVDRPGSPQTELRIGHVGLARNIPDFHAVVVMAAILGGLFNSRLNRLLREERGYTYGVSATFDLRRSTGPFVTRTAVQTEVTRPAVEDILSELRRIGKAPPESAELQEARDYLVGVFPLRFEAPSQVVAAIAGLVLYGLPDDELDRYRPAVGALTEAEVLAAAGHVRAEEASIVMVGDAARVLPELEGAGFGPVEVIRDPDPAELAEAALGS